MKILHVADFENKANRTPHGIIRVVLDLANSQKNNDNEVKVCIIRPNDNFISLGDYVCADNVSHFRHLLQTFQPNVIIFHSLYKYKFIKYSHVAGKLNIPYLIQFHGASSKANQNKSRIKKTVANTLLFNNFIKKAAGVIYLNNEELSASVFRKINSREAIIPNGVRFGQPRIEFKSHSPLNFTYLGRLDTHHKGLDILLHAIRILKANGLAKYMRLHLYGPNDKNLNINSMLNGLKDCVSYIGPVYGNEKDKVLNDTDIYILTSRYEGMPMTVLEALSHGCPCVLTPQTNMTTIVNETNAGWITSTKPEDVASKLQEIIESNNNTIIDWKTIRENAIAIAKGFDWDKISKLSIKCYSEFINI